MNESLNNAFDDVAVLWPYIDMMERWDWVERLGAAHEPRLGFTDTILELKKRAQNQGIEW